MNSSTIFLYLGFMLFGMGGFGVMVRQNPIIKFLCLELMLNGCNLSILSYSRVREMAGLPLALDPSVVTLIVMFIAAAEVVVGLAIIINIFRRHHRIDIDTLESY